MSDSFHDMNKINELSAELIKYLERYRDYIGGEMSYEEHLERQSIVREYMDRHGYSYDEACDMAANIAYERAYDDDEDSALRAMSQEAHEVREAITLLKKFTAKEDEKDKL